MKSIVLDIDKDALGGIGDTTPIRYTNSNWFVLIFGSSTGIIVLPSKIYRFLIDMGGRVIKPLEISVKKLIPIAVLVLTLISCNEPELTSNLPGLDFGTSIYHDSFLFTDSRNDTLSVRLKTGFNQWATDNAAEATFLFTDVEGNQIGQHGSGMGLLVNNEPVSDGKIYLDSRRSPNDTLLIELFFDPSTSSKKLSGFVQMEKGSVERINNVTNLDENPQVLQWGARQRVVMNPTLKVLNWTAAVIVIGLIMWFVFFKNTIYPKMGSGRLTIQTPYYKSIKTRGKRNITLTAIPEKQGFWSKLFTGSKVRELNGNWENEIVFSPGRNRNNLRIKLPRGYSMEPYSTQIKRGQSYTINKDALTIKFSFI